MNRLIGRTLSHYRIVERIGAGGMGEVYRAYDERLERDVALKVLPAGTLADDAARKRFRKEALALSKLNHPNIATVHDFDTQGDVDFLVMEYVAGATVGEKLTTGPMAEKEIVRAGMELAEGLAAAHGQGVIHRDLKPGNVRLTSDGRLKILDFGLAKLVRPAAAASPIESATESVIVTEAQVTAGTLPYMAPEQLHGDAADTRSDLWAAGAVLYELATGRRPFEARVATALVGDIQYKPVTRPSEFNPAISSPLEAIILKCLEKDPKNRYQSAGELRAQLESLLTPSGRLAVNVPAADQTSRRGSRLALALGVVVLLLAVVGMLIMPAIRRGQQLQWVREQAIPQIRKLAESGDWNAAYLLALRAQEIAPKDSTLASLWPRFSHHENIRSEPSGARVFRKEYSAAETEWRLLGTTPLDSIRLPHGFSRLRLEKAGFRTLDAGLLPWWMPDAPYRLSDGKSVPEGMVSIPGGKLDIVLPGLDNIEPVELKDFFMDVHEVTNRQFKLFVDSLGYQRSEFWTEPFVLEGRRLSRDEALARFVDRTGRPGPATWEAGDYPTGQADYPVLGVSWYEAAAYARFAGKKLPTIYAWSKAALTPASSWIVPKSNMGSDGPAPVGKYQGMGPYGTFDMAGNAREWCVNEIRGERYILGGGWNDPTYAFNDAFAQPPFDRSATNGFRLVLHPADDPNLAFASRPVERVFRDFTMLKPVPESIFQVYRRLYDYDRTPLNSVVEEADSTSEDWVRQRITFDAAYGRERVIAYLFLPRHGRPPYQTVVYFPGSGAIHDRSSRTALQTGAVDFILRSGRAMIYPIYKSTYERGDGLKSDYANESNFYKEHVIAWAKDLKRSIDYLETRPDIDSARLAYYGFSWGGYLGGLMPAVEPRIKAVALYVAGLEFQKGQPEVEPINFLPRIRVPVLMLNGRFDHYFPVKTSQVPMFNLLGTPSEQKRHVVYDGGHFVPRTQLITEVLNWLDRHLGPVR